MMFRFFRRAEGARGWPMWLALAGWLAGAGCSDPEAVRPGAAKATGPALYGPPTGTASDSIPRLRPMDARNDAWKSAPFACVQSELSPATLFHSSTKELHFFGKLGEAGLGAPRYAVFGTPMGPKHITNGFPADVSLMNECWVLVWFSGAAGWTNWDSPWAIFVQRQPTAIRLDTNGLHFEFAQAAGDAVLMPLFGYYKLPLGTNDILTAHGLPGKKLKSWEWAEVIPRNVLMRVRYWASASREFPLYCEDSFSVDRARDAVMFRQKFTWHSIDDDFKTRHLKVAPVSPPLGQVALDRGFPVTFSKKPVDLDFFTPYGPLLGIEGVDTYDATLRVLQYVNETEASDPPDTNAHPTVAAALRKLNEVAGRKFPRADMYEHDRGGVENTFLVLPGDGWYAKGLPFYEAKVRTNALASLRKYFHEDVLVKNHFQAFEYPKGAGREYLIVKGSGHGWWGGALGSAGKYNGNLLEALWAYAHFTGDWELVRERWPLVNQLLTTSAETRWASFGREGIFELGDEAGPCAAFARLAYQAGDMDAYNYGCALFARELVLRQLKGRGAEYFRRHQPWHSMDFMEEEVYLTSLVDDPAGWWIDGPNYPPAQEGRTFYRQYESRWLRFQDADVARFHRDYLGPQMKWEMDVLTARWEPRRRSENAANGMPSLVQLRSLLLNESPAELAKVATPDQFSGSPSVEIASCLAVLRASRPVRLERLIPTGAPSPFVTGLERDVPGPSLALTQTVQSEANKNAVWPRVNGWSNWKTPTGAGWTFGEVRPNRALAPASAERTALNWNARVTTFTLP